MNTPTTAAPELPATTQPAPKPALTIKQELTGDAFKAAIAQVLPKHLTPERMVRVAILAMTRAPKLAKCERGSFFNAMMTLSQLGLEPDGRRAHLIPFENRKRGVVECQLIVDYKGLSELVMRSGLVSYIHADVIREGDIFEYNCGKIERHVPHFLRRDADKPADAGPVFAAFALARMRDGGEKCEVMSLADINSIRDNSQGWKGHLKYGNQTPWDPANPTSEGEMRKKTVFRRLAKWLPLSPEFRDAIEADDAIEVETRPAVPIDAPEFLIPETAEGGAE